MPPFERAAVDEPLRLLPCPCGHFCHGVVACHVCFPPPLPWPRPSPRRRRRGEPVHGEAHAVGVPQICRVRVVAGHAAAVPLRVADDDAVGQRVQPVNPAQARKQRHGGAIRARNLLGRLGVGHARARLRHFDADVRAVGRAPAVPAAHLPRQRLVHRAVCLYERVHAHALPARLVLVKVPRQHGGARLRRADAVQHQALRRQRCTRLIALCSSS